MRKNFEYECERLKLENEMLKQSLVECEQFKQLESREIYGNLDNLISQNVIYEQDKYEQHILSLENEVVALKNLVN